MVFSIPTGDIISSTPLPFEKVSDEVKIKMLGILLNMRKNEHEMQTVDINVSET